MALPTTREIINEMRLNTQSAKSLAYLAIILLLIGGAVGAPMASAFMFGLASLCAAMPAFLAEGRLRYLAAAVTLLAGVAAVATYLQGDPAYDAYLERGRTTAPGAPQR